MSLRENTPTPSATALNRTNNDVATHAFVFVGGDTT